MEEREVITAAGEGFWGGRKYWVNLLTRLSARSDSGGTICKESLSYVFTFAVSPLSACDRRSFESEEKRRAFLETSFRELALTEIPESSRQWVKLASPVDAIVGCRLTAVNFVMDYLELEIPPYGFQVFNWPKLLLDGREIHSSDHDYQESLLKFVGKEVAHFDEYLDSGLTIAFSDASVMSVPLKVSADFPCPEVAEFRGPGISGFVWRANEEPLY